RRGRSPAPGEEPVGALRQQQAEQSHRQVRELSGGGRAQDRAEGGAGRAEEVARARLVAGHGPAAHQQRGQGQRADQRPGGGGGGKRGEPVGQDGDGDGRVGSARLALDGAERGGRHACGGRRGQGRRGG